MKKHNFHSSSLAVVAALFPLLFIGNPIIISQYFGMIMMTIAILFVCLLIFKRFGVKEECLTIYSNKFGINIQRDFFAVPIVYYILVIEMTALFILTPICTALNLMLFLAGLEQILLLFLLNSVYGGESKITKEKLREEY